MRRRTNRKNAARTLVAAAAGPRLVKAAEYASRAAAAAKRAAVALERPKVVARTPRNADEARRAFGLLFVEG